MSMQLAKGQEESEGGERWSGRAGKPPKQTDSPDEQRRRRTWTWLTLASTKSPTLWPTSLPFSATEATLKCEAKRGDGLLSRTAPSAVPSKGEGAEGE